MDVPSLHSEFLNDALPRIRQDARVVGVAITGSIAGGHPDGPPWWPDSPGSMSVSRA